MAAISRVVFGLCAWIVPRSGFDGEGDRRGGQGRRRFAPAASAVRSRRYGRAAWAPVPTRRARTAGSAPATRPRGPDGHPGVSAAVLSARVRYAICDLPAVSPRIQLVATAAGTIARVVDLVTGRGDRQARASFPQPRLTGFLVALWASLLSDQGWGLRDRSKLTPACRLVSATSMMSRRRISEGMLSPSR
jgi:hypothetical protein